MVNSLAGGGPPDLAALIVAELATLAADAQSLQAQLAPGDVVQAVVLPSNGLTDLLAIGPLRVAAELPPSLVPGQTITVEVTGFSGDRISLHILGDASASATARLPLTPPSEAAAATVALDRRLNKTLPNVAPPEPRYGSGKAAATSTGTGLGSTSLAAQVPASPTRVPASRFGPIEARLATSRATAPAPSIPAVVSETASAQGLKSSSAPVIPRPLIAPRTSIDPAAAHGMQIAAAEHAGYSEPGALLRALHIPLTAGNMTAARAALTAPDKLPALLEHLDHVLAATIDPRLGTLRALVGFLARIEPRSPVLATQIAAFADHIVTGRESKVAQLLAAHAQIVPPRSGSRGHSADSLPAPEEHVEDDRPATPARIVPSDPSATIAGRIAIRQAALESDLKTRLLTVVSDVGASAATGTTPNTPALAAAVTGVLTAVTALQIGAAGALTTHPEGLAFSLPIALPHGFAQAHVRIDRDASETRKSALDGDNFHIAFVLETQHLGTIAIDLVTVGRTITLGVQTEGIPAQRVFSTALTQLAQRFEALRYVVAKADAVVSARGIARSQPDAPAGTPLPLAQPARIVDLDA